MSQSELAEKAGLSRNYISLIERGQAQNTSMRVLNQLALALGVRMSDLIGQPEAEEGLIPPALREFALEEGLSYDAVDRLSRIPRRGQEPKTVQDWKTLYGLIRTYLEA